MKTLIENVLFLIGLLVLFVMVSRCAEDTRFRTYCPTDDTETQRERLLATEDCKVSSNTPTSTPSSSPVPSPGPSPSPSPTPDDDDDEEEEDGEYVCHNGKTLLIPLSALKGHLRHGDKRGSC